uniref:G-protein coupled receptors family 1 profile domain-containing protein n=1 Tax=Xenopus tropicalis TaxID=8364 RepID=A0A1B8Y4M2_XENTR
MIILMENFLIIYRIWVERSLPMHSCICLLFVMDISCTTAIVPNMVMGLVFWHDHISLGSHLFQMFLVHTAGMFKSIVLMIMAPDRYLVICRPLNSDIRNMHLLFNLFLIGLFDSSLFSSTIKMIASQVQFCRPNIIWNSACENMVLLNLDCGDISKIQVLGLMVRVLVTAMGISLLLVSYPYIFNSTMKIIIGKARHKNRYTCSTHLIVVMLNWSCGLLFSIL